MFNIGDLVKIKKTSEYYGRDDIWNPADVDGTIIEINEDAYNGYIYKVKWPLDGSNEYRLEDIESCEVIFQVKINENMKEVDYFGKSFIIPKEHKYMVISSDNSIWSFKTKPRLMADAFWTDDTDNLYMVAPEDSCTTYIDIYKTLREV